MNSCTEKKCPKCGQLLRFPEGIGGMLMACPTCGNKFHSDFKLGVAKSKEPITTLFEMPYKILSRICKCFKS